MQQKENSITFRTAKTKFCLRVTCNADESYLFVNKTEICKFKANNKLVSFCLGSVSKDFTKDEHSEFFLDCTVYDFSVDNISSIKKEDILNIHQYLMVKNNMFGSIKKCLSDY